MMAALQPWQVGLAIAVGLSVGTMLAVFFPWWRNKAGPIVFAICFATYVVLELVARALGAP